MSGEISTWNKTKDLLLVGAAAICVLVAGKILADVTEIKTNLAVYQADNKAISLRVERQERETEDVKRRLYLLESRR